MSGSFTESIVEEAALAVLGRLDWAVLHGPEIAVGTAAAERADPGYRDVILERRLRAALARLNPGLPAAAVDDAFRKLTRVAGPTLIERNRALHRMLVDGVTVEYRRPDGSIAGAQAQVIDYERPEANDWLAVNQFTVVDGGHERRPDVVLFLNGLPVAVIELKNPADEQATIHTAYRQLVTYQAQIPALFESNAVLVTSDGTTARIGALGAGEEWFKPWRTIEGTSDAPSAMPELRVLLEGVFEHRRLPRPAAPLRRVRGRGRRGDRQEDRRVPPVPRGERRGRGDDPGDRRALGAAPPRRRGARPVRDALEPGRRARRPARRRHLAHAGVGQEPDHGLLRRPDRPRARDGQPDARGPDRPQRPRRPAVRDVRPLPRPAAPGAGPGAGPRRPAREARRGLGRRRVHDDPEVPARRAGRHPPGPVRPAEHRGHRRRGAPQPVRLHRRLRAPPARRAARARRSSASPARRSSSPTPTPARCSATTSASTTSSARSATARRSRSTTRAGSRSSRSPRPSAPRSTRPSRRSPRARRSTARSSSRAAGRSSRRSSAPSTGSAWSPPTSSRTSRTASRRWTARRWSSR